jgi:Zn-dependent M28 family amino/carboxypeptidase
MTRAIDQVSEKKIPVASRPILLLAASFLAAAASPGVEADPTPEVSADRIKAHVAYLASDRLEGRGPGTRGEVLATEYLAAEFKKAGLKPVGSVGGGTPPNPRERGTYFQPVPLLRVVTSPKATLRAIKGETTLDIPCEEGFSGTSQTQKDLEEFDAEAVFVGHGITAPEFGWDDYKDTDVKGKVVVLFTNEPPSDDPKFFGGKALTYYGRWTYKFEEAARRGARACFIIHTTATAGYPYSVVRPLEGAQLKREPGEPALAFAGWLTSQAGEKLLGLSGRTVDGALKEADTKGFKPYPLGVRLKGNIPTRVEKIISNNVAGVAEGSDEALKSEAVVFTAHWDHLGVGRAVLGDAIYNGAADNATGCALLLELARAWSAQSPRPRRSAVFLAVTAEEKGLLGSKYYTQHPLVPLGKTALNLNFDMILPLGVPDSVVVTGADRTTAWPAVQAAAKRNRLQIEIDQRAHLGIFFRSDHFSMARAGVPAFSVAAGMKLKGKPEGFARKAIQEFNDKVYHSPQDELRPDWDFSGFPVLARFTLDVARDAANADRLPTWNSGDEFRPAREKSGVK